MNQPENNPGETGKRISLPQADSDPAMVRRRRFLNAICLTMGGGAIASVTWAVAGFIVAPTFEKDQEIWRNVGKVDDFKVGSTTVIKLEDASSLPWAGYAGQTAAYLRRDTESLFRCFSVNCTHLGCPVRWIETAQLFMCPCHGGVYYRDGQVAAGPPPKPLPQYQVRVRDGAVEVLASPVPITQGPGL